MNMYMQSSIPSGNVLHLRCGAACSGDCVGCPPHYEGMKFVGLSSTIDAVLIFHRQCTAETS